MKEVRSDTASQELENMVSEIERKIKSFKTLDPPQIDWQLYALLRRLGLTKYEILAYVALVSGGPQTISQITGTSSKTGIPQPRAYDVLGSLVKYGLVEESTTGTTKRRTKIFRSIPPQEGLHNLMNFFIFARDQALTQLENLYKIEKPSYGGIWEISSSNNLIRAAERLISLARSEILIVSDFTMLEKIVPTLEATQKEKGILISVIIKSEEEKHVEDILDWVKFLKIRYRPNFSMPYMVVDRKFALQWAVNLSIGQEIENTEIVHTLIDHFFFSNWRIGKSLTDVYNKDLLRRYPLRTVNIQTAINEIKYILAKDIVPQIEVKGTSTTSGEDQHVLGEVVKTEAQWDTGTFSIFIDSDGEKLSIGGMLASVEDISADYIIIKH